MYHTAEGYIKKTGLHALSRKRFLLSHKYGEQPAQILVWDLISAVRPAGCTPV